jgi:hypothetical protein
MLTRAEQFVDNLVLPDGGDAARMAEAAVSGRQELQRTDPALASAVGMPGVQQRLRARIAAAVMTHQRQRDRRRPPDLAEPPPGELALQALLQRHRRLVLPPEGTPLEARHAPPPVDEVDVMLTVHAYRDYLRDHKPTLVCAVCACRVSAADTEDDELLLSTLPHLELLSADRTAHPPTPELPRDALTTLEWPVGSGERHCLSTAGCTGAAADGEPLLRVCSTCHTKLRNGRVPPRSLVAVDTGQWPSDDVGPLPRPTQVEEALIAPVTVHGRVMIMRAATATSRGAFTAKKTLVGHVVILPGPPTGELAALLPRTFDVLAEKFLVSANRVAQRVHCAA